MNKIWIPVDFGITGVSIVALLIILFVAAVVFFLWYKNKKRRKFYFSSIEAELSKNPSLKLTIERDDSTLYLASRIWIELKTRQVTLSFKEGEDNLMSLYESWYELFQNLRTEIKTIPGQLVKRNNQWHRLITITTTVLNEGLRPHLTRYHTRFETWYLHEVAKPERQGQAPQDIQKDFPDYKELVQHLQKSNKLMELFTKDLETYILEG